MFTFPKLVHQLLPDRSAWQRKIRIFDEEDCELLRTILIACTELRLAIDHVRLNRDSRTIETCEQAQDAADDERVELERQFGMSIVTLACEQRESGRSRS